MYSTASKENMKFSAISSIVMSLANVMREIIIREGNLTMECPLKRGLTQNDITRK